jgi:hypothetical protein
MFCPRAIYTWWREVWLERVHESAVTIDTLQSSTREHAHNIEFDPYGGKAEGIRDRSNVPVN